VQGMTVASQMTSQGHDQHPISQQIVNITAGLESQKHTVPLPNGNANTGTHRHRDILVVAERVARGDGHVSAAQVAGVCDRASQVLKHTAAESGMMHCAQGRSAC